MSKPRFIFVTGGVCSGLGKGIVAASIGAILKAADFRVFSLKFDPYLNVDPGTMSPYQHGEVYVLRDGTETDLDLGHYERFLDVNLTAESNLTTGQVYQEVIGKERKGTFLGKTIQVIPHITDAIKKRIYYTAESSKADFLIMEIGGTVGDIEGEPFLEAARKSVYRRTELSALYERQTPALGAAPHHYGLLKSRARSQWLPGSPRLSLLLFWVLPFLPFWIFPVVLLPGPSIP